MKTKASAMAASVSKSSVVRVRACRDRFGRAYVAYVVTNMRAGVRGSVCTRVFRALCEYEGGEYSEHSGLRPTTAGHVCPLER